MSSSPRPKPHAFESDPLWFKDAIIYELHVKAFADSNGDGIGDFPGLISKLDYLSDLGVTALWLLPFYPSPLRDDGYDIADYTEVNPAYGTIRDFRVFLDEAHRRGLRVITELVINHTSNQHPWFQRARTSPPGSPHRDFYVWSDSPERYQDARIIFKDFESSNWTWDPIAHAYYWHRFYSHQPDLNFENPRVHRALTRVLDFWLEMGVDGMRLDAVPYLFEAEGTNCENLPKTHEYLKQLRAYVDSKYQGRMLLAEANQWPEDAAAYFGDGDECHMNFHFPLMPRMFMALHQENNFPILDILEQTPPIPENCQWAIFLRNHDELTLEMVTDEDRDYMYRVYAEDPRARINLGIRRRLAPLMRNRRKVELMTGLLLSLPGTPVLYYGDEIGMGDNFYLGDRDAVRTPMQWSGDRNAGFSRTNPQRLFLPVILDPEYHYEAVNVESQQDNPQSLLWWTKRILDLRKQHQVFGRGNARFLHPDNPKVLAFIREHDGRRVLVVANLSRFSQFAELDLSEFNGITPVELFGHTEFPRIGELPYLLTLSPHGFYWLSLDDSREDTDGPVADVTIHGDWRDLAGVKRTELERILPRFLHRSRWFRSKSLHIRRCEVSQSFALGSGPDAFIATLIDLEYREHDSESYILPLAFAAGADEAAITEHHPAAIVARLRDPSGRRLGIVYDATIRAAFADTMLALVRGKKRVTIPGGELIGRPHKRMKGLTDGMLPPGRLLGREQSNSSLVYGDQLVMKVFRKLETGDHPDVEISEALSDRAFPHSPAYAGRLELTHEGGTATVAIVHAHVYNQGDAWSLTLDHLQRFFENALSRSQDAAKLSLVPSLLRRSASPVPEVVQDLVGDFLTQARLLGERTADLHLALAGVGTTDFAPEAFSTLYQRSLYQAGRSLLKKTFSRLGHKLGDLDHELRDLAGAILSSQDELDRRMRRIYARKIEVVRIRTHGDLHLGQILATGRDFSIIDFEGEPARALGERRLKRSPLRDVAGMLRSFHYAAVCGRRAENIREGDEASAIAWDEIWYQWVTAVYTRAYLDRASGAAFLPTEADDLALLLDFYRTEKCVYELAYELDNRPDWIEIPLRGLLAILEDA